MSSSGQLHPTAAAMYQYIVRFKQATAGESPTRREMQVALGLASPSMVQHHLRMLERAGLIVRPGRGKARMIGIPGARWMMEAGADLD